MNGEGATGADRRGLVEVVRTRADGAGCAEGEGRGLERAVSLRTIAKWVEAREKFACLTCYDATMARLMEEAGVPVLLVGDTAAEVILGYSGTVHAPLEFMLMLTSAVKRGAGKCFVIGDMPFMSYQADEAEGVRNAGRFVTEGMADAVKLEVDRGDAGLVRKMARAGVPVVAHVGARPQRAKVTGGYGSVGRTAEEAREVLADATAMEEAGAVMVLLEAMPAEVSQRVVETVKVPVIGCGAGGGCHGQIVVTQDILGMTRWQPAFAKVIAEVGEEIRKAAREWMRRVRTGELGEHPYRMREGETRW